jgi:hypothetical protein
MCSIKKVIMKRDGLSAEEADAMIAEARELVADGEDPEVILYTDFGLEPDYVFDLLSF